MLVTHGQRCWRAKLRSTGSADNKSAAKGMKTGNRVGHERHDGRAVHSKGARIDPMATEETK